MLREDLLWNPRFLFERLRLTLRLRPPVLFVEDTFLEGSFLGGGEGDFLGDVGIAIQSILYIMSRKSSKQHKSNDSSLKK